MRRSGVRSPSAPPVPGPAALSACNRRHNPDLNVPGDDPEAVADGQVCHRPLGDQHARPLSDDGDGPAVAMRQEMDFAILPAWVNLELLPRLADGAAFGHQADMILTVASVAILQALLTPSPL